MGASRFGLTTRLYDDLDTSEQLVLWTFRAWVASFKEAAGDEVMALLQKTLRRSGLDQGYEDFDRALTLIAASAHRIIDVRYTRCDTVSFDEQLLLQTIHHLQEGQIDDVYCCLGEWVPQSVMRAIEVSGMSFAHLLQDMGVHIPCQNGLWDHARGQALHSSSESRLVH